MGVSGYYPVSGYYSVSGHHFLLTGIRLTTIRYYPVSGKTVSGTSPQITYETYCREQLQFVTGNENRIKVSIDIQSL
jgi:hypothetical protein